MQNNHMLLSNVSVIVTKNVGYWYMIHTFDRKRLMEKVRKLNLHLQDGKLMGRIHLTMGSETVEKVMEVLDRQEALAKVQAEHEIIPHRSGQKIYEEVITH